MDKDLLDEVMKVNGGVFIEGRDRLQVLNDLYPDEQYHPLGLPFTISDTPNFRPGDSAYTPKTRKKPSPDRRKLVKARRKQKHRRK